MNIDSRHHPTNPGASYRIDVPLNAVEVYLYSALPMSIFIDQIKILLDGRFYCSMDYAAFVLILRHKFPEMLCKPEIIQIPTFSDWEGGKKPTIFQIEYSCKMGKEIGNSHSLQTQFIFEQ